ncbi:polysaccharide biosynthesis/export family protein [Pseudogemmobacter sonorensis]|uniref:polysaccharide biosynthesis/export family protein n=1 Tax=Pseudogemmobacter sonorensis TaxID=2989681 RepID=UPI0036AB61F1
MSLLTAASMTLAGCNAPRGAGQVGQIIKGAEADDSHFEVHRIDRETVGRIAKWPTPAATTPTHGWISRKRGPASTMIQAGDQLSVSIWENDDTSLLSSPGEKHVALNGLTVGPDGSIFLPYAEKVLVSNMTPDEARRAIQTKIEGIMPSAQVLVSHEPGRRSAVDLVSGVASPGSYPLPDRDFSILSLIALGGGIPTSIKNPNVRLIRDGKLYGISAERLMKDPSLDTTLRGGDKVYVESDDRYFIALGASSRENQVPFTQEKITALEALSLLGGLNDGRANAKGILILRDYPASALRGDGSGPGKERVVFAIDLTTADGLFSAGELLIQNRDVVVVTESAIGTTASILGLFSGFVGLGRNTQALANND